MIIKVAKLVNQEVYIHGKAVRICICDKGDVYIYLHPDVNLGVGDASLKKHLQTLHVVEKEHRDMTRQFTTHYLVHGYKLTDVCNTLRKLGAKAQLEVADFLEEVIKS